jgi:hypothetical protein
MKALILAVLLLCSCDTLNELNEIAVPIDTAAQIADAIPQIIRNADLDGDGDIQGYSEWLQFVLGVYEAVFEREWGDETTLD